MDSKDESHAIQRMRERKITIKAIGKAIKVLSKHKSALRRAHGRDRVALELSTAIKAQKKSQRKSSSPVAIVASASLNNHNQIARSTTTKPTNFETKEAAELYLETCAGHTTTFSQEGGYAIQLAFQKLYSKWPKMDDVREAYKEFNERHGTFPRGLDIRGTACFLNWFTHLRILP